MKIFFLPSCPRCFETHSYININGMGSTRKNYILSLVDDIRAQIIEEKQLLKKSISISSQKKTVTNVVKIYLLTGESKKKARETCVQKKSLRWLKKLRLNAGYFDIRIVNIHSKASN
ncbi:hypothetical protein HZS_2343 [Henneguya salminicola]|nr:hypothetical protein HZS_2343 [Henneguya salminicola]